MSAVVDSTVFDSTVTDSTVTDSTVSDSTVTDSTVTDSTVTDGTATRRGRDELSSPTDSDGGLFGAGRRILHAHTLQSDAVMAAALLVLSTVWLVHTPFAGAAPAVVQAALIVPLVWRRSHPTLVFVVVATVALAQWSLDYRLLGDASLLIALYTVAVHESRRRAVVATAVVEIGAALAATRWTPAGTVPRSFVFLSATAVAALFAGLTVRSGSEYLGWLAERAERLEIERDQQKAIGAAIERTRIAREVHDIVAHSLSVVITLADAAAVVNATDGARATEAMRHVSEVGRQALGDMRTVINVLRTEEPSEGPETEFGPQPDIAQLGPLFERVEATGLAVEVVVEGDAFALGPAAELTVYRIIQEALTNTIKHASATTAKVELRYRRPSLELTVADNGAAARGPPTASDTGSKG